MQVWQAILVKKVDLDSKQAQAMMSDGARDLLKVCTSPMLCASMPCFQGHCSLPLACVPDLARRCVCSHDSHAGSVAASHSLPPGFSVPLCHPAL